MCCSFYLSNSDQGELELSKDNVTQTAILGAAWSDYEEDNQGTTLILEYDLVPSKGFSCSQTTFSVSASHLAAFNCVPANYKCLRK